jgi:uncharacterized protein (DUF2225 family)
MTTLCQIQLSCPVCSNEFTSRAVTSTNAFGGKATDFHERAAGEQPLPYLIHTCPWCGYTGSERDFGKDVEVMPLTKARVWNELAPKLTSWPMTGSDRYEFAAKIAIWQGTAARWVAELLLRAAWCCVDEGDVEAERYFRRHAAWVFERALGTPDGVAGEERAGITYLVGELWRRVGDLKEARRWFDAVPGEVVNPYRQQWIINAAKQQRDNPKESFRRRDLQFAERRPYSDVDKL